MTDTDKALSRSVLPKDITSYDLLKTFAVITMVIDHIGFFFFPDNLEWRAVGRWSFPVWLFLVGYAKSRDLSLKLWIGAGILVTSDIVFGLYIFPLSILATIIAVRLILDYIMIRVSAKKEIIWPISAIIFFIVIPSFKLCEYGSLGIIMAMFGWLVRNGKDHGFEKSDIQNYMMFTVFTYITYQQLLFNFSTDLLFVMGFGAFGVIFALMYFKSATFPKLTKSVTPVLAAPIRFMGRRTLEIYVFHLVLFKFIGLWYEPDRFALFDVQLMHGM